MWKRVVVYGVLLAAGTLALQWLDFLALARLRSGGLYVFLIALVCLALGVAVGVRLMARGAPAAAAEGNPRAVAALGLSAREMAVLQELAAGLSNKEIARRLDVSPNTVKTHVAHLYEKLGARRRTEAVMRARELGILA
ncbi:MAG: response regulator transcription factor [Rubrivivax sp.]